MMFRTLITTKTEMVGSSNANSKNEKYPWVRSGPRKQHVSTMLSIVLTTATHEWWGRSYINQIVFKYVISIAH